MTLKEKLLFVRGKKCFLLTLINLISTAIQEKYLNKPKAQFQLVKDLRETLSKNCGSGNEFDYKKAGKAVLDVLLDSFHLKTLAKQNSEVTALTQEGMSRVLAEIVTFATKES